MKAAEFINFSLHGLGCWAQGSFMASTARRARSYPVFRAVKTSENNTRLQSRHTQLMFALTLISCQCLIDNVG